MDYSMRETTEQSMCMTELRNLTRQEWQTRLAGQMVSTGTELQVTSYEELRSFIQEELGELFEEDVQK